MASAGHLRGCPVDYLLPRTTSLLTDHSLEPAHENIITWVFGHVPYLHHLPSTIAIAAYRSNVTTHASRLQITFQESESSFQSLNPATRF